MFLNRFNWYVCSFLDAVFIGLHRPYPITFWTFYGTNVTANYNNFAEKEPNLPATEHCVAYYQLFDYLWVDIPCSSNHPTLCELEMFGGISV